MSYQGSCLTFLRVSAGILLSFALSSEINWNDLELGFQEYGGCSFSSKLMTPIMVILNLLEQGTKYLFVCNMKSGSCETQVYQSATIGRKFFQFFWVRFEDNFGGFNRSLEISKMSSRFWACRIYVTDLGLRAWIKMKMMKNEFGNDLRSNTWHDQWDASVFWEFWVS